MSVTRSSLSLPTLCAPGGLRDSDGAVHESLSAALELWASQGVLANEVHVLGRPCTPAYESPVPLSMRVSQFDVEESSSDEEDHPYQIIT